MKQSGKLGGRGEWETVIYEIIYWPNIHVIEVPEKEVE